MQLESLKTYNSSDILIVISKVKLKTYFLILILYFEKENHLKSLLMIGCLA